MKEQPQQQQASRAAATSESVEAKGAPAGEEYPQEIVVNGKADETPRRLGKQTPKQGEQYERML